MNDLDWLYGRQRFGVRPGLDRVEALLDRLGGPERAFDVVLVGGTNGKGSTSASLAAMLAAAGRRVGLFTSPHLTRFSERFRVSDGGRLPELPLDGVLAGLATLRPHAEEVGATFFEVVTALGALLFAEARVDVAVMEVGLGGRLDSTNVLDPVLSVITNVGLDHTEVLGDTAVLIAGEKAGILRAGRPAVTGVSPDLLPVLDARGSDLWALGRDVDLQVRPLGWEGWEVRLGGVGGLLDFRTPLLGTHGAQNAALAALAAMRLGVAPEAIREGAARTEWPGRLERVRWKAREVLLDGAHNPDGARALVAALRGLGVDRAPLVFGAATDKPTGEIATILSEVASEVILTRALLSPRAADPQVLRGEWAVPARVAQTPAEALDLLPPGRSVVAGSLYLIGEVRPLLLGEVVEGRERWQ